ncbi:TraB/GumN family protein [Sulfurovum mangrovi]|uniref:TraB/GumN family protein n=1 Tax=Sulfurovum mangrovi TaxID=2893889 RepID=UPI001E46B064|nr:TraB/GumN family protein [Sulfurovum mangrovi]UFH60113.1 TraB/GumN family protein [Sulfurovum mangrovi]
MRFLSMLVFLLLGTVMVAASSSAIKAPFLWHVNKGKVEFYLFGTMHLADPSLLVLPAKVEKAVERSDAVYTEVSMEPADQLKATRLMLRNDGKTLQSTLPSSLYQRSREYLKSINPSLQIEPFEHMKLWAFSAMLQFLEAQLKHPALPAIDRVIYQNAKTNGKEVGGIETVEEQLAAMEALNDQEQLLMHEATLDYLEQNRDYVKTMQTLYLNGDEKALMEYLTSMMFQEEKYRALEARFMELILYERNRRMTQRIIEKVTGNPEKIYLFAFGTMHFLDRGSVIELLEKRGFNVVRVK